MKRLTKLLLGSFGLAAIAGTALAADRVHVMNVALPDGSVRQIRYVGEVAPRVVLVPVAAVSPIEAMFGGDSPFAMLDQVSAMMDRQADALLRQAAVLSRNAPGSGVTTANLPAGATGYSYTAISSSTAGGCTQSVQMTSFGSGQAPKVVRQSSGDCSAMGTAKSTPAVQPAAPAPATPIIRARYVAPADKAKPVTPVI